MNTKEIIRRVRFAPYRKGMGPRFTLAVWDTFRSGFGGKRILGYRLTMAETTIDVQGDYGSQYGWETVTTETTWKEARERVKEYRANEGGRYRLKEVTARTIIFEGEDFGCSPLHCIDSDETVKGIMGFLTCKPGDTDPEYFDNYTPEQLAYCSAHAEALDCEVDNRFGE